MDPEAPAYRIDMQSEFAANSKTVHSDFETIADPEDMVLKEHFEDFRSRFTDTNKQLAGRVFNRLIDDVRKPYVRYPLRPHEQPIPYPGLLVVSRKAAGIGPYPENASRTSYRSLRLANFAMQAGSLISIEPIVRQRHDGPLFRVFTLALIDKLKSQL